MLVHNMGKNQNQNQKVQLEDLFDDYTTMQERCSFIWAAQ